MASKLVVMASKLIGAAVIAHWRESHGRCDRRQRVAQSARARLLKVHRKALFPDPQSAQIDVGWGYR
jgi:hypothetical protein